MSMGEIFWRLLNRSITAGWLILVVVCIRFAFRKMPKWMNCVLWGVVAVRLIIPFSVESVFSLQPSSEPIKYNTMMEGEILPYVPSVDGNLPVVRDTLNSLLRDAFAYESSESAAPLQIVMGVAGSIWLCGTIILLVIAIGSMVKLRLKVREAVRDESNIYLCDRVKSPFIMGIVRPRIYLPSSLNGEEKEYILAHENAHLQRLDHFWKPFSYLLLCVYWFNPLCWAAYVLLCKDIELACDEKVIGNMSFDDKKEYSRVLLACANQRRLVLSCPLAFGEIGVRDRVKSVLNYKKTALGITVLAAIVCIIVAVCFLTNPSGEDQEGITSADGITSSEYADIYGEVIANLKENELFAIIETNAPLPVLLVTSEDMTFDDISGERATLWCDVYYPVDGIVKQIGLASSSGTAYPIAYDKTGIYEAGGHGIHRYEIDCQNGEMKIAEAIYMEYDEDANESYYMEENGNVREITEEEFLTAWEKYSEATVVSFQKD